MRSSPATVSTTQAKAAPASPDGSATLVSGSALEFGRHSGRLAILALLTLAVLWGWRFYSTWATWGNLTVDCGREMYVPALVAEGKTLYLDVDYPYLPAAPYVNAFLFRAFGVRLRVLYWAGALAALGCAFLLYLIGAHLHSPLAGWTSGAVVVTQSFQSWLFSFPLPYSFAAVYGCLAACLFLWLAVCAARSSGRAWLAGAGIAAAVALLCKVEFGAACWLALLLLVALRAFAARHWKCLAGDAATLLPGIALCGLVFAWMVSLGGLDFITRENLMATLPGSYFLRTYGSVWLQFAGLTITAPALGAALEQMAVFAAILALLYFFLRYSIPRRLWVAPAVACALAAFGFATRYLPWQAEAAFRWVFFPQQMVLFVFLGAVFAAMALARRRGARPDFSLLILFAFSAVLGLRILLGMVPAGYPIYYNGPAILSYLILAQLVLLRLSRSGHFAFQTGALLCLGCLVAAWGVASRTTIPAAQLEPLETQRGTIRVTPHLAANYRAAIQFMQQKAAIGESVLSVPEDVSLYFLSATHSPVRALMFAPGIVVPGKMEQDTIREIEQHNTRYLLWSNRTFEEYGAPVFGRDFNPDLGRYLTSHFHPVGPLLPDDSHGRDWTAVIWERNEPAGAGTR